MFKDIEQTLGLVPGFLKMMPPTHLAHKWRLFKDFELSSTTALPPKVKELIALAVASTRGCDYCAYFHTVAAGLQGALAEEVNETLLMVKHIAGWGAYFTGVRYDLAQFKQEVQAIRQHMLQQQQGQGS